jgi:uncharacterized protein (TIGR00369 family)
MSEGRDVNRMLNPDGQLPRMDSRIRENFGRQKLMQMLQARLVRVEPGLVEIEMDYRDDLTQQHGFLHAGVTTSLADSACGYAALTQMRPESDVLSVEFKVNLLRPASGQRFRAIGKVVRAGKTLVVTQGEVLALDGTEQHSVLLMQATMMQIANPRA